jgi:hypothetical protein
VANAGFGAVLAPVGGTVFMQADSGQEREMKALRIMLAILALLAVPYVASAQGRSKPKPRLQATEEESECKPEHREAIARARAEGREAPPGLEKKCADAPPPPAPPPPPPPPSEQPPAGIHLSKGFVYEDIDGSGSQEMSAGEMGLAGWTVQLYWNGQLVTSTTSGPDGEYEFPGLGASALWSVCVIGQAGYNRTQPLNGDACGGAGYNFQVLESPFLTWYERHFGMMMQ